MRDVLNTRAALKAATSADPELRSAREGVVTLRRRSSSELAEKVMGIFSSKKDRPAYVDIAIRELFREGNHPLIQGLFHACLSGSTDERAQDAVRLKEVLRAQIKEPDRARVDRWSQDPVFKKHYNRFSTVRPIDGILQDDRRVRKTVLGSL